MERTRLADRLQEYIAGVCLIVGALLLAPTTYFEYTDRLRFWAGAIGLVMYAVLLPGLLEIARVVRASAPRLGVAASLVGSFGCVGDATFQATMLHEWAARTTGTPQPQLAAILGVTTGRVFPVLVMLGIQFPLTLVLLSIGLFRTGVVPTWVPGLLGLGAVLFPVGHIGGIQSVQHLAETLLLIPLVWLGLHFFTGAPRRAIAASVTA